MEALTLSNTLGLWALVGIPIVLLIHFLQRQSQELTISTLFLLEQMQRESVEGRRFERIRSSLPLWLQLLMVLLITWLLVQPRWLRSDSVQPIAVVLDNSASMSAFESEARTNLLGELNRLAGNVALAEYYVIESTLSAGNIYRGTELSELDAALPKWTPSAGEHEFEPSLRVARNLVGKDGLVFLVTDHPHEDLPFNASLLAVGSQKPNVGFAGLRVEEKGGQPRWTAMIRNYQDEPVEREWFLAVDTQRSTPQKIQLGPGQIRAVEGPFPENAEFCTLHLSEDAFTPDNVLPLARPKPRELLIAPVVAPELLEEFNQMAQSIADSRIATGAEGEPDPDIYVMSYDPLRPATPDGNAIVFLEHFLKDSRVLTERLVSENHSLMDHLNWEPLIVRRSIQIPRKDGDEVLLWQDSRPLIMLRSFEGKQQLLFNFDLKGSNALKLPAFIVLVHRFAESVRQKKPALERKVLETGQALNLNLAQNPEAEPAPLQVSFKSWDGKNDFERTVLPEDIPRQQAPIYPGYLTVRHQGEPILVASTFFADTREADLSKAASQNGLQGLETALVERHTETDSNWVLWLLILALVLVFSWGWMAWRQSRVRQTSEDEEFPAGEMAR